MTKLPPIDPELRALLQEIARDSKARLFRAEIPRPERLVLAGVPSVGLRAAGLTSAERELLRVYRADVAKLLRDAAEWRIQQDPLGAATSSRHVDPYVERRFPDRIELLDALRMRTERVRRLGSEARALDPADRGAALLASPTSSAAQLAGLSLRLVQDDAAWIQVGRALMIDGLMRPALQCLSGVVRRGQDPWLEGCALTYVGAVYSRAGMQHEAAMAYSVAIQVYDSDLNALLSCIAQAFFSGDKDLMLRSAARADEQLRSDSPGVLAWIEGCRNRKRLSMHGWPRPASPELARDLADSLGPTTRRVLNAIQ